MLVAATTLIERIERPQEGRGFETQERGWRDVEWSERRGFRIERAGIKVRPLSSVQPLQQIFKRGDRFCGRERAMSRPMNKGPAQVSVVVSLVDDIFVGAFVLVSDQPIARGVHGQHGKMDLAIEDDVLLQVLD